MFNYGKNKSTKLEEAQKLLKLILMLQNGLVKILKKFKQQEKKHLKTNMFQTGRGTGKIKFGDIATTKIY